VKVDVRKKRTARCACGDLTVALEGEPYFVAICNCTECQRRTGSVFGVSSYFRGLQIVAVNGEHRTFVRSSDSGSLGEFHFCPRCGTTVFWSGVNEPASEGLGIAVGCLTDPDFPKPTLIAWCASRYEWAVFPPGIVAHETQPDDLEAFFG
jgi:hypothetical protein